MSSLTARSRPSGAEVEDGEAVQAGQRPPAHWQSLLGASAFAALVVAYVVRVDMSVLEVVRLCLGAIVLWGPFALVVNALAGREIDDGVARFALAVAGSYALTPTVYFLSSMAGAPWVLYLVQAIAVAGVALDRWRRRDGTGRVSGSLPRPGWVVLCLVALALFTTAPYTKFADVTTAGTRNLRIPSDSLYYVAQSYEVSRQLPPAQDATRAGTPARAYHLLPHVTTVLLARATGQPDLLRAQIVYHLTLLTVLTSTLMYALGKILTRRRLGGYALVALLYPLALVGTPLLSSTTMAGQSFMQFYFTPLPQLSSMLDPVALGSWQSYSAIVVVLGLMLAVAALSLRLRDRLPCSRLLVYCALVVAALSRFRAQIFMVALPALLLVVVIAWLRTRRPALLVAGIAPLLVAIPLLVEAGSSRYRPGSSGMQLGFNGLTVSGSRFGRTFAGPILSAWPFSRAIHDVVDGTFGGTAGLWAWQAVCLTAFVLLNMIGPLGLIGAAVYFTRRSSWSTFGPFTLLVLAMAVGSLLIGVFVKSDFDSYSLAGQALYLPPWYLFPALAAAAVAAHSFLQAHLHLSHSVWLGAGIVLVLAGALARETGPPSRLARFEYDQHLAGGDELSPGRWEALAWVRKHTPHDAVIVSADYVNSRMYFSGLGGRATYLEGRGDINETEAQRIYGDDRSALVADLWTTPDPEHFCTVLDATPATHVVEFATSPLAVDGAPCLALDWFAPSRDARVWSVQR